MEKLTSCLPVLLLDFHLSGVVYCVTRRANVAQPYAIVTKQCFKGVRGGDIELITFTITKVDKEKLKNNFKTN